MGRINIHKTHNCRLYSISPVAYPHARQRIIHNHRVCLCWVRVVFDERLPRESSGRTRTTDVCLHRRIVRALHFLRAITSLHRQCVVSVWWCAQQRNGLRGKQVEIENASSQITENSRRARIIPDHRQTLRHWIKLNLVFCELVQYSQP